MSITLVTGGTGFIGSALVRLLLGRGERVRVPTRRVGAHPGLEGTDVDLVEADLTDSGACLRIAEGCRRVYHLAGWISTRSRHAYIHPFFRYHNQLFLNSLPGGEA